MKTSPRWLAWLALCMFLVRPAVAADGKQESGGCTDPAKRACGAVYFTHSLPGQLWRKLGPSSVPTLWIASDTVPGTHPSKVYQVMWRLGDAGAAPDGFQMVHALGGVFYYRSGAALPPDPSTFGYSQEDFSIADAMPDAFPDVGAYFPDGAEVRSCTREGFSYYLIVGKKDKDAFLLIAPASMAHLMSIDEVKANVAILPVKFLRAGFDTVRDNLNYYFFGGDYEVIEMSAAYYYLGHQPEDTAAELKHLGKPAATCPEFPTQGDQGLTYPDSWKQAVQAFKD